MCDSGLLYFEEMQIPFLKTARSSRHVCLWLRRDFAVDGAEVSLQHPQKQVMNVKSIQNVSMIQMDFIWAPSLSSLSIQDE